MMRREGTATCWWYSITIEIDGAISYYKGCDVQVEGCGVDGVLALEGVDEELAVKCLSFARLGWEGVDVSLHAEELCR